MKFISPSQYLILIQMGNYCCQDKESSPVKRNGRMKRGLKTSKRSEDSGGEVQTDDTT